MSGTVFIILESTITNSIGFTQLILKSMNEERYHGDR